MKNKNKSLHTELGQKAVPAIKGAMINAAEEQQLPDRFVVDSSATPKIKITDKITGRSTVIGLFAYGDVRQALNDLFADVAITTDFPPCAHFAKTSSAHFSKMPFEEQRKLAPEQLPAEVFNTFKDWKTTFDESTREKKLATSAKLQAHFAACDAAGIDRSAAATVMFKVKF